MSGIGKSVGFDLHLGIHFWSSIFLVLGGRKTLVLGLREFSLLG